MTTGFVLVWFRPKPVAALAAGVAILNILVGWLIVIGFSARLAEDLGHGSYYREDPRVWFAILMAIPPIAHTIAFFLFNRLAREAMLQAWQQPEAEIDLSQYNPFASRDADQTDVLPEQSGSDRKQP